MGEESLSEDGLVPRDSKDFKCEYCGQGGFGEQHLKKHIKSNHSRKCFIKDIIKYI